MRTHAIAERCRAAGWCLAVGLNLLAFLWPWIGHSATVTGNVSTVWGLALNTNLAFVPKSVPNFVGGSGATSRPLLTNTDGNGNFAVNLRGGGYVARMGSGAGDFVTLQVPTNAATYSWETLVVSNAANVYPAWPVFVPYSQITNIISSVGGGGGGGGGVTFPLTAWNLWSPAGDSFAGNLSADNTSMMLAYTGVGSPFIQMFNNVGRSGRTGQYNGYLHGDWSFSDSADIAGDPIATLTDLIPFAFATNGLIKQPILSWNTNGFTAAIFESASGLYIYSGGITKNFIYQQTNNITQIRADNGLILVGPIGYSYVPTNSLTGGKLAELTDVTNIAWNAATNAPLIMSPQIQWPHSSTDTFPSISGSASEIIMQADGGTTSSSLQLGTNGQADAFGQWVFHTPPSGVTGGGGGFIPTNADGTIIITALNGSITNIELNNTNMVVWGTNSATTNNRALTLANGAMYITNAGGRWEFYPDNSYTGSNCAAAYVDRSGATKISLGTNGQWVGNLAVYGSTLTLGVGNFNGVGLGQARYGLTANSGQNTNVLTFSRAGEQSATNACIWVSNTAAPVFAIMDGAYGTAVSVGIRTTSPQAALHVNGMIRSDIGYASWQSNRLAVATLSPTGGAATWNWTNSYVNNVFVFLGGGSISSISINGTSLGTGQTNSGLMTIPLQTNEWVTATYSSPPTATVKPW